MTKSINQYIEQTNLSPTLVAKDVDRLIKEATEYDFWGICVPPFWIKKAKTVLRNTSTKLISVVGFPLGYQMTETKLETIRLALKDGADELDVVMNISAFKSEMNWPKIELAKCSKMIHEQEKIMKVIIETAYLDKQEISKACKICADAGADFVKTSTGFAPSGAWAAHIKQMRAILPPHVGIKASGGIKTYKQALSMIEAGADRIGTSNGLDILNNQK